MVFHDLDYSLWNSAARQPECRWKIELIPVLVPNSSQFSHVRKQLNVVLMPHWKLSFIPAVSAATRLRIPRPDLVRIDFVQFSFESTTRQMPQVTMEVSVYVIGMIFILHKRTIHEDFRNPSLPQFRHQDCEVFEQNNAPH